MAQRFTFEIVTPREVVFSDEVYEVLLPTPLGQIGILPGHLSLHALLVTGVVSLRRHADTTYEAMEDLAIAGGFVEISGNHVRVFADAAERADDIDELKVQQALARAQQLQREAKDQVAVADAIGLIEQQATRLKVAELRRRRRN